MAQTYPPGQVSLLGQKMLSENRMPHITFVGHEGTRFFLAGPLAPVPGAQSGLVLQSLTGLSSPFEHLDVQGARQDGTTWLDSVYNFGEIDAVLELSGLTAADSRTLMRTWLGANSPKETGRIHVFTPETGEWWADVRQLKSITDPITAAGDTAGRQKLTWAWRNDDAYWKSFDSVSSFGVDSVTVHDDFAHVADQNLDGSKWSDTYTGNIGAGGGIGYDGNGCTKWYPSGYQARTAVVRKVGTGATSATDNQIVSIELKAPPGFDLGGGVYVDIWARMDSSGGNNGIRCRIGGGGLVNMVILSSFVGGVEKVMWSQPLTFQPQWNEKWTLICGTSDGERHYRVMRGKRNWLSAVRTGDEQFQVLHYVERDNRSHVGSSYRGWGFGMAAGGALAWLEQVPPPPLKSWEAGDNVELTQEGFLTLSNRGDQEAWPRYVCYGPGTFTFSDGPSPSDNTVTFGPLLEGQIALITTTPRLRSVVDLSPVEVEQPLNKFQKWLKDLLNNATNNNLPPLLEKYESQFGILPPQGPMYGLLTNRFTKPVPAKLEGQKPPEVKIATSITGGNAASRIVAAITPQRLWPL